MTKAMMAHPEHRHPFAASAIHAAGATTVLYPGKKFLLTETGDGDNLLVSPEDLTRLSGFELKAEGACLDELCIPLTAGLLVEQDGRQWFDLTAFADLLGQPYVTEPTARVWSFAEVPAKRERTLKDAMAPEFEVHDRQGKRVTLADLKGKKALIVTWSSW